MKYLNLSLFLLTIAFAENNQIIFENNSKNNYEEYNYCEAGRLEPENYSTIPGFVLKSVQVVTRHGDRTPLTIIPKNENVVWECNSPKEYISLNSLNGTHTYLNFINTAADPDYTNPYIGDYLWKGTCFPGQLTEKGSEQHKNIGQSLRDIYINKLNFINEDDISNIFVRSTNVLRTRLSVQSLLSTFLVNNTNNIPIHTIPEEIETIHINRKSCKNIDKLFKEIIEEDEWKDYIKENMKLKNKLDDYIGVSLNEPEYGFTRYIDSFLARKCHNLPLPCKYGNCHDSSLIDKLQEKANFEYSYFFSKSKLSKKYVTLGIGYFLRELINNMGNNLGIKNNANGDASQKVVPNFFIYSGHDTTVAPILGALGYTSMEWPPYASNLVFELWRDENSSETSIDFNDYSVRIFYNGKVLKTNWCNFNNCPLSSLFLRLKKYFPSINECFE